MTGTGTGQSARQGQRPEGDSGTGTGEAGRTQEGWLEVGGHGQCGFAKRVGALGALRGLRAANAKAKVVILSLKLKAAYGLELDGSESEFELG